jgi:serine/threonine protein kinase/WD40 repeat protein
MLDSMEETDPMMASRSVHPTEQTLLAYGLGHLDDASAESVHDHLESCSDCRRRLAELSSDRVLGRPREVQGRPRSPGPLMSSTAGLSILAAGAAGSPPPPPASTLPPGLADHPDYEITRELGRGGMGVVYLARNRLMGRMEVLKVVGSHLTNRGAGLDRFLGEIRNAARLHHPNIVTAYSALRIGESLVLAMEYVEGLDLSRLVKAKGQLPVVHACNYTQQAALGLQHADEHGMVHRDIKPSNLMLTRQGDRALIKVLDFGLAKVRSEGAVDVSLTHEGQMLGTPDYIAPEQIRDARRADIRADIYSLGCTLYYLLTGGPPFRGECLYDILQAHQSMEAMPLNLKRPEVPMELAALVAKMMAKDPERRFQRPRDVARALAPFFKKGTLALQSPEAEVSHGGQSGSIRPVRGVVSAPSQPVTNDAGPRAQREGVARPSAPETEWSSRIDRREAERTRDEAQALAPTRRPRWLRASVAGGVLLLALFVAWAGVVRVKTSNGTIELVNLPKDADVFIDGEKVAVTWPGGGKPAVISVTAAKHKVSVKKDGLEFSSAEMTVRAGGKEEFIVRLVPPAASPAVKGKTDESPTRPESEGNIRGEVPPDLALEGVNKRGAPGSDVEGPAAGPVVRRETLPLSAPTLADRPVFSPFVETMSTRGRFQRLFNGKDLTGWKTHPNQKGNWHVANGVLIGSGPALSHLYTERGDFSDFHLRVEARFNQGGSSGVYLRCPFGPSLPSSEDPKWPDGFEATINNARVVRHITGGIYPGVGEDVFIDNPPDVPSGQWFTMEVIADGNALGVRLNGKPCAYKFARNRLHRTGHIALQQYSPKTVIEFRTIDIKELNRPDQKDSREIRRWPGMADPVTRVAFSPDGLGILSGGNAMEVMTKPGGGRFIWYNHGYALRLWAVASGRNLLAKQGDGWMAGALAFSSDSRYAASSEVSLSEQPILIWDLKAAKCIQKCILNDKRRKVAGTALSFSPDDRRVMAASTNGVVRVWDLVTGQEQPPITLNTGPISQDEFPVTAFTSDRQHLATGSRTGVVEFWELDSGKKLQAFAGHAGGVRSVACSANGRLVLSAGNDSTVRLWDVAGGKELKQLMSDDRRVRCVAFSPDSRRALSAGLDGPIHLWDLASGKEVCRLEGHTMGVNSVAFSPDGRWAVSGSQDTTVRLWQLP